MNSSLPIYKDAKQKLIDWKAHRNASLKDRLEALRPFLTGCTEEKFEAFKRDYPKNIDHGGNNELGAVVELEFLEQKVWSEGKIVEILQDDRGLPNPIKENASIKNPDFKIDGEIYEVKGIGTLDKTVIELGQKKIQKRIQYANDQIKGSGYQTPSMIPYSLDNGTTINIPQGVVSLHIKGDHLTIDKQQIRNAITGQCTPTSCRSIKRVDVYHENNLILQFELDKDQRMRETTKADLEMLNGLKDYHQTLVTLKSENPTKFNDEKTQNTIKRFTSAVQNSFQNEYPDLKLKPMNLNSVEKAIDIMQHNRREGITLEPENFRSIGIKQSELNQFIDQGPTIER